MQGQGPRGQWGRGASRITGGTRDNLPLLCTCVALQLPSSGPQPWWCPGCVRTRAPPSGRRHPALPGPSLLPAPLPAPAHPQPLLRQVLWHLLGQSADPGSSPGCRCTPRTRTELQPIWPPSCWVVPSDRGPLDRGELPHHADGVTTWARGLPCCQHHLLPGCHQPPSCSHTVPGKGGAVLTRPGHSRDGHRHGAVLHGTTTPWVARGGI